MKDIITIITIRMKLSSITNLVIWLCPLLFTAVPVAAELPVVEGTWNAPVVEAHKGTWTKEVVVHAIHVDDKGLIWSGSSDGLRLYAGGSPKVVSLSGEGEEDEPAVLDIAQRKADDQIWYLTDKGVGWVEADTTRSAFFPLKDSAGRIRLQTFDIDDEGQVWITSTHGLFHLHPESGNLSRIEDGKAFIKALKTKVDPYRSGIVWFCSGEYGLIRYDVKKRETREFFHEVVSENSELFGTRVDSFCFLSEDEILFGGRNVLSRLRLSEGWVKTEKLQTERENRYRRLTSLIPDPERNLIWVGTKVGEGLMQLDLEKNAFTSYGQPVRFRTTRKGFDINEIAIDRCGVVWMATDTDGLARSASPTIEVNSFTHNSDNDQSFYKADVKYLVSREGRLLAQTSRGIAIIDSDEKKADFLTGPQRLGEKSVHGCVLLKDGTLFSAFDKQIQMLKTSDGGQAVWTPVADLPFSEGADWVVFAGQNGDDGSLWMCYRNDIYRFDPDSHELRKFSTVTHWVDHMAVSGKNMWIGTQGYLYKMDTGTGEAKEIHLNDSISLFHIYPGESEDDKVYITTSEGLFTVDAEQMTLSRVSGAGWDVRSMLPEKNGNFWLVAGGKLKLFDPVNECLVPFPAETEFNIEGRSLQKITRVGEDRIGLGGWAGVHFVSETALLAPEVLGEVPVVLLDKQILGPAKKEVDTSLPLVTFDSDRKISLPPNQYGIRFRFGMPDYRYPDENKFEYKLDKGNWSSATDGIIEVMNLKSGDHQVVVRAFSSPNSPAGNEYKLTFRSVPPFNESPAFSALIVFVIIAVCLLLHQLRTKYVVKAKKKLEEVNDALHLSEKKYRRIFERSSDIIILTDTETRILDCNPAASNLLGYENPDSAVLAGRFSDHLRGERSVEQLFAEVAKGKPIIDQRFEVKTVTGEIAVVLLSLSEVEAEEGAWQFQIHDISSQVNLEEQFRHAQKMEAVGTLAGGIAHDFNNLLSPIIVHSQMAKDDLEENGAKAISNAKKAMGICQEAAITAAGLVKDLLHFARQTDEGVEAVDLVSATESAIRLLEGSIPSNINICAELPDTPAWIKCSAQRLGQAIMNIGVNASHAIGIHSGSISVTINSATDTLDSIVPGDFWEIRFTDTGCGMGEETVKRVFEPFFTTKSVGEGSGLGLSMVHTFVEDSGGTVLIESQPGTGTTISLRFPALERKGRRDNLTVPDSSRISNHRQDSNRKTEIMVVDDDKLVLFATTKILEKHGYKITPFNNPVLALEAIQKFPGKYSVVVSDQMMPGLTGLDLARKIKECAPELPVVLLTGFSDFNPEEEGGGNDIYEVHMKPLDYGKLNETLQSLLTRDSSESLVALVS